MNVKAHAELLVATKNPGKVRELTELLAGLPLRLRNLSDFPAAPEVDETGATFEENARLKAVGYGAHACLLTLADDSGLEVAALGGAPGVRSARYAGDSATDADRVELLLRELSRADSGDRRARFVCAVALHDPLTGATRIFTGDCPGLIVAAPRGTNGFGYDPVFVPDGHDQTFAELPADAKHQISHRARALRLARDFIRNAFGPLP
ncbi:MAG TPA: RdgB/HAM1 family non-canonical purine NTP pyrophosphatase [Pyrinomonadaceae bacterium]